MLLDQHMSQGGSDVRRRTFAHDRGEGSRMGLRGDHSERHTAF
jgi:hypothetical protein